MLAVVREPSDGESLLSLFQEEIKTVTGVVSTESSVWGNLEKDLELFTIPAKSIFEKRFDFIITDSHIPDVLRHQLLILTDEYPTIRFQERLEYLINCLSKVQTVDHFQLKELMILLKDLIKIERNHASNVQNCRARDGVKGRAIIPDYDTVNAVGCDIMSDSVVKSALERSNQIADAIHKIPFLDWTKLTDEN